MSNAIDKTRYLAGVQCLRRLYLLVHQPEFATKTDAAGETIIEQGHEIGMLARRLFRGGITVNEDDVDLAIRRTRELLADPNVSAIFEGTFRNGGVLVRVDILHRRGDGRWRMIEVKSTTEVKDHHLEDVAIQYRVLSRSGVDLASACVAHVNRGYVYSGGDIDVWRFFRIRNVTRIVQSLQPKLTFQLRAEWTVLGMPTAPDLPHGRHCTDPITCEFYDRCNPQRPDDHISCLPRLHANAIEELEQMGVESIHDVPDDFELTEILRRAATCVQTGQPWFDREGLKKALGGLEHPLYFADFETVNPAIPKFGGMKPYDQLPFQWSVHVVRESGADPEHLEYVATDTRDTRREFTSSLCRVLGDRGSIVVYSTFESQRLAELARWLPEYAERIDAIQVRLFDLLPVVREHTYHPAYTGSFSIKSVLPALVPEMTYEDMEVSNGRDAGLAWQALVRGGLSQTQHESIMKALLDYCGRDTSGLLRICEALNRSNE